mgnify:CR=1 FL=1
MNNEVKKNLDSKRVLDVFVIGFDMMGKNPTNRIIGKVILALLSREKVQVEKAGKRTTINAEMYNPIGVVGAFAGFDNEAKRKIYEYLLNYATHADYEEGFMMVNPEKANLVVRVMHKGVLNVKEQPRYRLFTEMKPFVGPAIPISPSPLDRSGGRGTPTDQNRERMGFGGKPEVIPKVTTLQQFDTKPLPLLRSPTITALVSEVDGFEDQFIEKDDTYSSRFSERSERLTFTAPLDQLPFNNPLAGPEPILDEAYEGPMDVQTLLTLSINPPTDNWSAHRQRVPWDFAPNAFGKGSAFRTFKMDDKTSRRKAIHMDGWNRRYDKYKGVQAIAGRLLNGKWHIQSIRVPRHYGLRRTLKEVRLDRKRPPKWYKELHPQAKPFGTKKNPQEEIIENPIMPRNAIAAMDEGWTGYPTWAIQPTLSISDLQGNPPWAIESQTNPYIMMKEPFPYQKYNEDTEEFETTFLEVPIDEKLAPLVRHLWDKKQATWYSDSGRRGAGYFAMRKPFDYALKKLETIESDLKVLKIKTTKLGFMKKAEEMRESCTVETSFWAEP